ncbi:hypothetical protein [Bacillus massilinigeriensis]|nr:hypothetical protein [Bacillus massilionigeriensis]
MAKRNAVTYTGRVLDQRNDLTASDNPGEKSKLDLPKHVPIQDQSPKQVH